MLVAAAVIGTVAAAAAPPRYGRLPVLTRDWTRLAPLPDGTDPVAREQWRQGEITRRWHEVHELVGSRHVSRRARDLLRRRGLGPALLAGDAAAKSTAWTGVDTLKVLLVRIAFAENRDPDLTTIPASGDFMLDPLIDPDPLPIDPPPHGRAYFESHLAGLSDYYRFQSGGRLHIEGRVLPDGDTDSYKLTDIADYGPGADGFWTLESLERLVRDMIVAADQGAPADGVDLGDYDDDNPFTYIIFVHSGSDWQSDVNGDSPNDIPTFFVTLGEPQELANGRLNECSVIPETTNQDGYPGSIAAAFYHEFGHALGLPDVYSTRTGLPSVGIWDLMDSGTNLAVSIGVELPDGEIFGKIVTGVLPPSLSAWNKWFLGWIRTAEIDAGGRDYRLQAVGVPTEDYPLYPGFRPIITEKSPQALRGGLTPREWFLLENRWVPAGPAETPWDSLKFERDESTGVIQYLAGYRAGEWRNSGLYDYFLPAGGVLVWHVNMDRIEAGLADNTINADGDGLRLLEADGIQDVGVLDAYVLGWYGSALDPFGGYEFDIDGNRVENGFRNLYVEGFPASRCFDRAWSGLELQEVQLNSQSASVMRFGARIAGAARGFPWEAASVDSAEAAASGGLPGARAVDPASLTTLSVGGAALLVFADAAPRAWSGALWPTGLNALNNAGAPRWGSPAGRPLGEFAQLTAPLAGPPAGWELGDGSARLLAAARDGSLTLFDLPAAGQPAPLWTVDLGDSLAFAPVVVGDAGGVRTWAVACLAPDSVVTIDLATGTRVSATAVAGSRFLGQPRAAGPSAAARTLVFTEAGWTSLPAPGSNGLRVETAFARTPVGGTWTVSVGEWAAVYDDEGLLGAWFLDGTPAPGPDPAEPLVAEPAVADLDGDGRDDLVLATPTRIHAARTDATTLTGFPIRLYELFPLPDTTRIRGPLVVADADGDAVNEIFFDTDGGHLLSLTAAGRLRDRFPLRWGDRVGSGLAVGAGTAPDEPRRLWLASAGGYSGPPFGRQLTGGRLVSLELAPAAGPDGGTSEWLAAAGGPDRGGPVGAARDLGPSAPAAAESGRVVLYPNPVDGQEVTVRFHSAVGGEARLTVYNIEGEPVAAADFAVAAGLVNEHRLPLPGIASGLYLCRLQWPGASGRETRTLTLAVER